MIGFDLDDHEEPLAVLDDLVGEGPARLTEREQVGPARCRTERLERPPEVDLPFVGVAELRGALRLLRVEDELRDDRWNGVAPAGDPHPDPGRPDPLVAHGSHVRGDAHNPPLRGEAARAVYKKGHGLPLRVEEGFAK